MTHTLYFTVYSLLNPYNNNNIYFPSFVVVLYAIILLQKTDIYGALVCLLVLLLYGKRSLRMSFCVIK